MHRRVTTRRSLLGSTIALVALAAGCSRDGASSAAGPTSGSWGAAGTSARAASPTPAPTSAGSSAALVDPLPPGAVTMLLFGTDSRQKTSLSGNSDAIVLAQFSADRHHLSLVSIARDSHVAIPGMGKGKINAAFAQGGTPQLVRTVSQLLGGIHIPITVQANFTNFIALTRWMKGITVDNKHASTVKINSTGRVLDFHTGRLTLENTDALVYARERKSLPLGDLDRAERHRALVTGMVRGLQAADKASPQAFATLAGKLATNVKIAGLDPRQVPALAAPLRSIDTTDVTSLLVPISRFDTVGGAAVDIVDEQRTAELARGLAAGDLSGYVKAHGTGYAPGS